MSGGLKSLKKRRRVQVISLAGISLALVLVLLWFLPDDSFQFFRSPSEVAEAPPPPNERFRIGGLVAEGSLVRGQGEQVSFSVTDGGSVVPVVYTGILPDLFEEGQ
ncbi:cytochrome c maturation protein CcmE, partial [Yoonia sp.]